MTTMKNKAVAKRAVAKRAVSPAAVADTSPGRLLELAISKDLDMEKLERLMMMQVHWEAREAKKAFYAALSEFQANCPEIPKSRQVSFQGRNANVKTEYKYASLGDVVEAIKKPLFDAGMSYRFRQEQLDGGVIAISCIVTHLGGHSEETTLRSHSDESGGKNSVQAVGSAITYLRRYTLTSALGIAEIEEDDDGAAVGAEIETIPKELIDITRQRLRDTNSSEEDFLKVLKVGALEEILESKYGMVDSMLRQKEAKISAANGVPA